MDNNELQKQYEYLREKASRLRKALAIETDVPNKFKLEQQVAEAEKELSEFEKRIEFVEANKLVLNLKGQRNEIYCTFGNKATIGRSLICDFCIIDDLASISNLHAAISYNSGKNEYWLEDLKSANGTYINDERIEKPIQISSRDKIKLGSTITFIFEHNRNDSLSSGVFIQHNSGGEEIIRYIIAPRGKLLVGSNFNEVVRFPVFRENHSLGSVEKKVDGFYFFDFNGTERLLEHNIELLIDFFKIGIAIPKIISKESFNATEFSPDESKELSDDLEEIERPSGEEKPPYLRNLNIFLGFGVLFIGLLSTIFFKPDTNKIAIRLVNECLTALQEDKESWQNPTWPPQLPSNVVFLKSSDGHIEQYFIEQSGVIRKGRPHYLTPEQFSKDFIEAKNIQSEDPEGYWLGVGKVSKFGFLKLQVAYWSPQLKSRPEFEWEEEEFLYKHLSITLLVATALAGLIHRSVLDQYRQKLQIQYEEFQKKRTDKIFEAKSQLNEARLLAQKGQLAQALIMTNTLLKLMPRSMPVHNEIVDLKKIIQVQVQSGGGAITLSPLIKNGNVSSSSSSMNSLRLLYLRILGTPYAYQAPYGLEEISVGRQRRKQGNSENVGNDVTIRVPGSDQKSLRISRRHLEIKRINTEYFVINRSHGHTKLNGKVLSENQPYRLQSGDRLSIADVLILEVLLRVKMAGSKVNNLIKIDPTNYCNDELLIEASIGDMLTEVFYEES